MLLLLVVTLVQQYKVMIQLLLDIKPVLVHKEVGQLLLEVMQDKQAKL